MIDHSNPHQRTTAVYWALNVSDLKGLIDQIKTRLAELAGELRSMTSPVGNDLTAPQATNAVNLVINGKNSKVNIAQANDGGSIVASPPTMQEPARKFWTIGKAIAGIAVGGATIGAFLLT
jgi:hypothetical protein